MSDWRRPLLSKVAAQRLEEFAHSSESPSRAVTRMVNSHYNQRRQSRPLPALADRVDAAREKYNLLTGKWPEDPT